MSSSTPSLTTVLEVFTTLDPPGTPLTTPEVTEEFDCADRTIYNKLDALVENGSLETKKVGARGRVWWRPPQDREHQTDRENDSYRNTESEVRSDGPPFALDSGGEMGKRIGEKEWSETPIGPMDDWPQELRVAVDIMLGASEAIGIYWGSELTLLYNDAWRKLISDKHPEALGQPAHEVFPEIWDTIEPMFTDVLNGEVGAIGRERFMPLERNGQIEDAWFDYTANPIPMDDDSIGGIFNIAVNVTERKEIKQKLQTEKEQLDIAVENSPLVLFRQDTDLRYTWVKSPATDFDDEDTLGKRDDELLSPEAAETVMAPKNTVLETGEGVREELTYEIPSGEATYDVTIEPLHDESGEIVGLTGAALDITDRKQAEEQLRQANESLERLNVASRELIDADTETISDRVATLTRDILGVEYVALWRYDETVGQLREHASHTAPETDPDAVQLPDESPDQVWQTFIGDEVNVDNDLDVSESLSSTSPLRSRVLVPLGKHGVIDAGSTQTETFDEQTVDLVESVALTVKSAWNRAEGEAELARQNEELAHLDRLYSLIWEINRALVDAETSDALDETVCELLADSELYEFAWIGDYDADANAIEPRAWGGVDSSYLDELTTEVDGSVADGSPFISAIQTGEMQVVTDIATDPRATPWREATLKRGARSYLSLPLVYDESVYGVLAVYTGTPQDIERDSNILAELGETIAHAIHALETRETLQTDSSIELTLRSTAADTPLCRLARQTGCVIEFEGLVPGADGDTTVFFTAVDVSTDELVAAGEQSFAFEELHCLADSENGTLFKARPADPTLASQFLDRDATLRTLTINAGTATAAIDLPETAAVREFIEGVQQAVPDIEMLSRRTRTRSLETEHTFLATFEDRLTPRQQEILQFAYRSGFFESPRVQTGNELSEALDISQSTFTQHLREAQRRLCAMVFDNSSHSGFRGTHG
ncbi:bacterio-opsin activator domain-containing protein [Haladaptatus sp. NG-WS-4]